MIAAVNTTPQSPPSTYVVAPEEKLQKLDEPTSILTRAQRAALGLSLPTNISLLAELKQSIVVDKEEKAQKDHLLSTIDGAFLEAVADLQQINAHEKKLAPTEKLTAEHVLKNTFQQVSLYDMLKLDANFRSDTIALIQFLYPDAGPCGGHLPVQSSAPQTYMVSYPPAPLTDYQSPRLTVSILGKKFSGVIVDGGSGINLMPEFTMLALSLQPTRPGPFIVTLTDQRTVYPLGIVEKVALQVQNFTFELDFVVVRIPQVEGGFPLLIGRPWLRHTKALHDWGSDSMWTSNPGGSRQSIKLEEGIDPSITQSALTIQSAADNPPTHSSDDELLEWLAATKGISCYGITVQRSCGKLEPDDLVSPGSQLSTSTKASQSSAQMFQRRFLPCPIIDISLRAPKCLKRIEGSIKKCRPLTPWVLESSLMTFALLYFIALGPAVFTGVRLTESSFINNTSMVFGQCLRALLEHQKNPKKSFQRHFQYSMLTRYLKPYMEANGRMTLIVNVSPCEKDYLDTAFVLRQVAPYSKIRVLSISSKESCEGLNDEKRNSSATESQQPTTKRRKVDGSMIKSIDVYSLAKIGKPKKDPRKKSQGRFNEVCTSRGEGADHGVNDSMEATKTIEDTLGDWKANLVTEVNHILIQAGVKNFDQISQKIVSVLDNGGYYHASEGVESRLREQLAEIMSLRTNFLKEQQHAAVLLTEVEHLKKQYKDLENHTMRLEGRNSLGANCATKQITQSNSEGQEQALRAKVLGEDMNGYFASACQKPFDAEKLVDKLRYDPEGLNDVPMEDSSARLLTVTPFKGTVCGVREEQNVVNSETDPQRSQKVCTGPSHGRAVPFCSGIEQEEGLIICEFKEDLSLDGIALPITTESQCSQSQNYLEGPGETQATCHKHFEGSVYIRQQQPQNESSQFAQVSPSLSIDLTLYKEADEEEAELAKQAVNLSPVNVGCNGPSPSLHYGEDEVQEFEKCHGNEFVVAFARVGSCNSKEDSTNQILPTSREAQCLCLGNHVIETKEKQATCHQETDYYDQQDSQIKSLEIQEASPNLHKTFDSSSGPEEVQAVLDKEIHNDLSMNRNMVAGDFTTHLGEDNQQSDKLSILGHRNDFVTLQQELVNSKTVHLASNRDSGLSEQCFNKDAKSNFQKGKLLALALMQESKEISEDDGDHVSQQVNCRSRSPSHIGILGPIGHDLELEIKSSNG
ncbi:hypothetical protein L7F22_023546 [Adiantum nelumboides]|nr:hypothetical protein [Adiantum nelumboides]